MPIDWRSAEYVSPQIKIENQDIPLEAIKSSGDKLQTRYDTAYENATKTGEALRQMAQEAHPLDQPEAKQIFQQYNTDLQGIAAKGDYENQVWKTAKLAGEAVDNYKAIKERADKINKYTDYINTYSKIADPRDRKIEVDRYAASLNKLGYDPTNRVITGLAVGAPKLTDDPDIGKWANETGSGIIANATGYKSGKQAYYKAGEKINAQTTATEDGIYDIESGHQREWVSKDRVREILTDAAKTNPDIQSYLQAKREREQFVNPNEDPNVISSLVEDKHFTQPIEAYVNKFAHSKEIDESIQKYNRPRTGNNSGNLPLPVPSKKVSSEEHLNDINTKYANLKANLPLSGGNIITNYGNHPDYKRMLQNEQNRMAAIQDPTKQQLAYNNFEQFKRDTYKYLENKYSQPNKDFNEAKDHYEDIYKKMKALGKTDADFINASQQMDQNNSIHINTIYDAPTLESGVEQDKGFARDAAFAKVKGGDEFQKIGIDGKVTGKTVRKEYLMNDTDGKGNWQLKNAGSRINPYEGRIEVSDGVDDYTVPDDSYNVAVQKDLKSLKTFNHAMTEYGKKGTDYITTPDGGLIKVDTQIHQDKHGNIIPQKVILHYPLKGVDENNKPIYGHPIPESSGAVNTLLVQHIHSVYNPLGKGLTSK
jgi:hypothetical protein